MTRRNLGALLVAVEAAFAAGTFAAFAGDRPNPSALFLKRCAKCHGEDGTASTPKGKKMKAQDFTDPDFQQHKSDDQLIEAVTNGTDKDMPPFGKVLTPEEIRSLVTKDVRGFSK